MNIDEVVLQVIEQSRSMKAASAAELVKTIFNCGEPLSRRDVSTIASKMGYSYCVAAVQSSIRDLVDSGDVKFNGMEQRVDVCGRKSHVPMYVKIKEE